MKPKIAKNEASTRRSRAAFPSGGQKQGLPKFIGFDHSFAPLLTFMRALRSNLPSYLNSNPSSVDAPFWISESTRMEPDLTTFFFQAMRAALNCRSLGVQAHGPRHRQNDRSENLISNPRCTTTTPFRSETSHDRPDDRPFSFYKEFYEKEGCDSCSGATVRRRADSSDVAPAPPESFPIRAACRLDS
jgi:hypothetical protein